MKRIFKYLIVTVLAAGTMFYSCETTELEDLVNPNALTPDQANADLLFNAVQVNFLGAMQDMQYNGAALGRISYMSGRDYYQNFSSGTVSSAWSNLYSGMLPDIARMEALNGEDNALTLHLGISKALAAHVLMGIVDSVGDVPWSEAGDPDTYPSPAVDDDKDVYDAAMLMLDEAQAHIEASLNAPTFTGNDLYYNADTDNWIKYINTLRFRYHVTVGTEPATILDFISSNPIISTADADLQFNYGDQELQPDTRHPFYQSDYTTSGANIYQSSWLMDLMDGDQSEWLSYWNVDGNNAGYTSDMKVNITSDDPRRRYYFYRQSWVTPGSSAMFFYTSPTTGAGYSYAWPIEFDGAGTYTDGETLSCSLQLQPIHLEFTPDGNIDHGSFGTEYGRWCANFLGYWGRHHGNDEGTPPDNFTRTASGVYPAGGSFDNQPDIPDYGVHVETSLGDFPTGGVWQGYGGGGAGIWPIYLSSYVHFMVAETQLAAGQTALAAQSMRTAMEHSMAKVTSMSSVDPDADPTYFATQAEITAFIDMKIAEFENAPETTGLDALGYPLAKDQLDVLGEQYFVAMYGGANDAWNFIRRTGHPRTLSRGLMDNDESGLFPRTGTYPSGEISANPSILQRQDNSTLVFWDQGVVNPAN